MRVEVLYLSHESFLRHDAGDFHPERPARLLAVRRGAELAGLPLVEIECEPATPAQLELVHDPRYIAALEAFCASGGGEIDRDTVATPQTWEAALRAAGAGLSSIDRIRDQPSTFALAAVRPPGHHATADRAMGFCFFNNVAVTAAHLAAQGERVAIVDWDVHHGNGTQEMFYDRGDILYLSLHQWGYPFFPLTGGPAEVGTGAGEGLNLNFAFPPGSAGDVYERAFQEVLIPVLVEFAPGWLLLSAGFDADARDPLAELQLEPADYQAMAHQMRSALPAVPVIAFLEGGYDLSALSEGVGATLVGFSGANSPWSKNRSPDSAFDSAELSRSIAARYWSL